MFFCNWLLYLNKTILISIVNTQFVFQTDIKFFFTILALCHNVQISSEDMKKLSARLSVSGDLQLMNLFRRKKIKAANITIGGNTALEANGGKDTMGSVAWNDILTTSGTKMDYQGEV